MTYSKAGALALLSAAIATTCACSSNEVPTGDIFPPRPFTVDAGRTPPCELLDRQQELILGLDEGEPATLNVNGQPSPTCTWQTEDGRGVDYNGQYIAVDAHLARSETDSTVIQVNGFGAVQSVPPSAGGSPYCQITIDVADDRSVRVQANTSPGGPQVGIDEQCRRAVEAASMVMTTLVATASR